MGEPSRFDKLRHIFSSIFFRLFLWINRTTEKQYFESISQETKDELSLIGDLLSRCGFLIGVCHEDESLFLKGPSGKKYFPDPKLYYRRKIYEVKQ